MEFGFIEIQSDIIIRIIYLFYIQTMLQSSTHRSSHQQPTSKNKLIHLLKRIAQLQLRETRYVQKIRYLQAANLRLANEKQQQLQLMECHPTSQIETLIKNLQSEIKRLSNYSSEKSEREKEGWIKKFEQITDKSNRSLETEREKRMELEYEIKILRQSKLAAMNQNHTNFNNTLNLSSSLELQNQKLKKELEEYKLRNQELQNQYNRLQSEIQTKFEMLDEQITLYQKQKQQSYNNICRLQQQLKLRESCDGFSFSHNKESRRDQQDQEQNKEDSGDNMDINCYKSSIESLLEENTRLKKSIMTLEQILKDNDCQIPKQIEIQLSLSHKMTPSQ